MKEELLKFIELEIKNVQLHQEKFCNKDGEILNVKKYIYWCGVEEGLHRVSEEIIKLTGNSNE